MRLILDKSDLVDQEIAECLDRLIESRDYRQHNIFIEIALIEEGSDSDCYEILVGGVEDPDLEKEIAVRILIDTFLRSLYISSRKVLDDMCKRLGAPILEHKIFDEDWGWRSQCSRCGSKHRFMKTMTLEDCKGVIAEGVTPRCKVCGEKSVVFHLVDAYAQRTQS